MTGIRSCTAFISLFAAVVMMLHECTAADQSGGCHMSHKPANAIGFPSFLRMQEPKSRIMRTRGNEVTPRYSSNSLSLATDSVDQRQLPMAVCTCVVSMQSNQSRICASERSACHLSSFFLLRQTRLGLSVSALPKPLAQFLDLLRQEAMIPQGDKLRELPSPQVVGIPCA